MSSVPSKSSFKKSCKSSFIEMRNWTQIDNQDRHTVNQSFIVTLYQRVVVVAAAADDAVSSRAAVAEARRTIMSLIIIVRGIRLCPMNVFVEI